jgi:hypothetical protein
MAEPQDTDATAAASPSNTASASATHGKKTRKKKPFRFGASLSVFNYEEVWEDYKKKLVDEFAGNIDRLGNKNASKCMAVATANGTIEVNLIKALLPNLKSLSVFMPDDEKHAADVKVTIEREFPGVDVTVIDATVQEFVAESESGEFKNAFDVAFVAHILFYLEKEERQELYNVLLDDPASRWAHDRRTEQLSQNEDVGRCDVRKLSQDEHVRQGDPHVRVSPGR